MNRREIINRMTLEEKAALLSGKDFWRTKDFEKYGIESIEVSDGPCGLRKQMGACDHLGFNNSVPATAQLSGPNLAATWDKELIGQIGEALGTEAKSYGVDILLGPAINIQRSPLCGRHFEYYSEDPYLTGKVATAYINGVQSKGVGACIKHFAANNQETEREYIDTIVDERTLREIYLAAFEEPIKNAKPWAVMTALNKINGEYCCENRHLLVDVLRNEWNYDGFVMSDWWGVNDRSKSVEAGLDLEMPYSQGIGQKKILEAVSNNKLDVKYIDDACERIMRCAEKASALRKQSVELDLAKHHELVQYAASQSLVLLKNEDHILPIDVNTKVALIGEFMEKPRYKAEGSALVNPSQEDIPLEEIKKIAKGEILYAQGYSEEEIDQEKLILEAQKAAKVAEVAILFVGLPLGVESEGHDRKNLHLPSKHLNLINAVTAVQSNVIVVLANGGPLDMPWLSRVKGVFECFLAGQGMGKALAALLYGRENPSGKLPFTFPKDLCQTPSYFNFPGDKVKVEYKEGIFVGYRYYDKKEIEPLFPFGYGLSYTQFSYSDLRLDKNEMTDEESLTVTVKVKNIGKVSGKEVIQLYVGQFDSSHMKPEKELKGFEKIYLEPQEEKTVSFELDRRAFAFYHAELKDWYVDRGSYRIMLGGSSRNIQVEKTICITPVVELPKKITGWSKVERFNETEVGRECFEKIKQHISEYAEEPLISMAKQEDYDQQLGQMDIRMLTIFTQTVINNDVMEEYLRRCNEAFIQEYIQKRKLLQP